MSRYVVDASVAIKWFIPEIHSEEALRLLAPGRANASIPVFFDDGREQQQGSPSAQLDR